MPSLETVAALSAVISAAADVYSTTASFTRAFAARRKQYKANVPTNIKDFFSKYSDLEVKSYTNRISACQKRFIREGDGKQRRRCLCSVLSDIRDGNNGFPEKNWEDLYDQLGC